MLADHIVAVFVTFVNTFVAGIAVVVRRPMRCRNGLLAAQVLGGLAASLTQQQQLHQQHQN
jgi:hypothetical protein